MPFGLKAQLAGWTPHPPAGPRGHLAVSGRDPWRLSRPAGLASRAPRVRLLSGPHTITGTFEWDALPEMLPVPAATGLLALTIRGQPVAFPNRDAQGWVQLAAGRHSVLIDGALPERDTVQIPLPFKPHHVEAHVDGWRVDGLHEDGVADDSLQLTRLRPDGAAAGAALQPGTLPPFARLTRQLHGQPPGRGDWADADDR
jgi:hypothetical protein